MTATPNLGWNTYGSGLDAMGRDGQPEHIEVGSTGHGQLRVRVDAVGLCFSDVKLIKQGAGHPKLYGRDLASQPTRLGHEATVTVLEVGDQLAGQYHVGERLAIQPDIHVDGVSTAYGYTVPGGLIQHHLIGQEVLGGDEGPYVIPVPEGCGLADAALSEPWACVEAAYTQRRRLEPLPGGRLLLLADGPVERDIDLAGAVDSAGHITLLGIGAEVERAVRRLNGNADVAVVESLPDGADFDDIIVLEPRSAELVSELARRIAFRGVMLLAGTQPLDGRCAIDLGRMHYHYTAYLGTTSPVIREAYGRTRNRADLVDGGVAVFVGAGGPMGQMHVQRALESERGPATVIAVDPDEDRLAVLRSRLSPLAERVGRRLVVIAGDASQARPHVVEASGGAMADDVVVSVPVAAVMEEAAELMGPSGMFVAFAGVPNGTMGNLDMSNVYLGSAQFTGTSGSGVQDQVNVLAKVRAGTLSPSLNLAAIGGIGAARDGVRAVMEGRFAGKVLVFPQVVGLPLVGLDELADVLPEVAKHLGPSGEWTERAEQELLDHFGVTV